ncbi:haloacid dehalogenase superfamily enzyme, subfamily IA [mine drainage metagenome]|uniref:Haloacid dehalogenase superfamily enzyme, subfamily IA n=1 Tax=mine drainage metagenome TaxID=410659 RepID=T1CCC6_9ZZZZ
MFLKRIIFFDGDGTLWYPKRTKYNKPPWSVYVDSRTKRNPLKHQTLTPHTLETLKSLKRKGIKLAVISTQPGKYKKDRDAHLHMKLRHFGISRFFDYVEASKVVANHTKPDAKSVQMLKVLRKAHLPKSSALMIGDLYESDYAQAKKIGIDAVLIDRFEIARSDHRYSRVRKRAHDVSGVIKYI